MKRTIVILLVAIVAFILGSLSSSHYWLRQSVQTTRQHDLEYIQWAYKTHRLLVEGRISDATKIQEEILGMYLSLYNGYTLPGEVNSVSCNRE